MNEAEQLIAECERRGVLLEPRGDLLFIAPEENVTSTPGLVGQLRRRKHEIISVLEARRRASFTHLARQVIQGEFDGCERGVRIALMNELNRYNKHRLCLRAFSMLYLKDLGVVP
jgi:hypothetical protein